MKSKLDQVNYKVTDSRFQDIRIEIKYQIIPKCKIEFFWVEINL